MKTSFLPLASRALSATAALALLTTSALAQAPAPAAPAAPGAAPVAPAATPAPKPLNASEKGFIKNSGKAIYYLVQLSGSAKTAVTDEKLGRLRDTVTKDMNKAWEALTKVAKAQNETLVGELQGADKSTIERLGKQKDDKFVKAWLDELAKESKKLDRDFETASKTVLDPELKTFVANYGAVVRNVFTSSEAAEKGFKGKK